MFFSTINRNPKAYLFAILGAEYVLKLLPRGTHDYARFMRPAELVGHARTAGLEPDDLTGMTYNPLTRIYRLGADTTVNYLASLRREHDAMMVMPPRPCPSAPCCSISTARWSTRPRIWPPP